MKYTKYLLAAAAVFLLTACGRAEKPLNAVEIRLDDAAVQVDGTVAISDPESAVYVANDIVYYESGKGFTYGQGTEADAHSKEEAAEHTVVHITQPGIYRLSGKLSKGQIAVDLGENAEEDPEAVVTLILNNADITCQVAPAVIFYRVYECGDAENPVKDVDTTGAGANVVIADGSVNNINGSYVARIYKPDSVKLNEAGTEVEEAKKLHKYDGAFYSRMSMNITGNGTLNIEAENEGLDSEMHLTINGGNINIYSGNDGINTNEDGVSVTTVNGGKLNIRVTGQTGEGDGIDSNGWLVINGGTVTSAACSNSADAGLDSDMGIHITGGTVIATGNMLDRIEDGGQTYAVFTFANQQSGTESVYLKNGKMQMEANLQNGYSILLFSSPDLKEGTYTLWSGEQQLSGQTGGMGGGMLPGGMGAERPEGMEPPEGLGEGQFPEDMVPPEDMTPPEGFNGMQPPTGMERPEMPPEGMDFPERPDQGQRPGGEFMPDLGQGTMGEQTKEFKITKGANMFNNIVSAD